MQRFVPVVVALVVGILLGAWQPRGEVLSLRAELDKQQAQKPCKSTATEEVRNLLGGRPTNRKTEAPAAPKTQPPIPDQRPDQPTDPTASPTEAPTRQIDAESVEEMVAVLNARRAQSMQALTEQADLNAAQQAAVEQIFDTMNSQLKASVEQFVASAEARGSVNRRDMMALGADVLDLVVNADDQLHQTLPAEVLEQVDEEATDPFAFVSGDAVEAFVKLQEMDFPE